MTPNDQQNDPNDQQNDPTCLMNFNLILEYEKLEDDF